MKFLKTLSSILIVLLAFTACSQKKSENKVNLVKPKIKAVKQAKKTNIKLDKIKNLSNVFTSGDKLIKEQESYNKEASKLMMDAKKYKSPFSFKKQTKFKDIKLAYTSNSTIISVYPNNKKLSSEVLFYVSFSHKNFELLYNIQNPHKKELYNIKFQGHKAKHGERTGLAVLLKNNIEISIQTKGKTTKGDKLYKEIFAELNIKEIESVFDKDSSFPDLKKYLLAMQVLNKKIDKLYQEFQKKLSPIEALTPFFNFKNLIKNFNLSPATYDIYNNLFSVKLRSTNKKNLLVSFYLSRPKSLDYLKQAKESYKIEGFEAISTKGDLGELILIIKLPKLTVKLVHFQDSQKTIKDLKPFLSLISLKTLAKIK